jgi:hypothetical protein
MNPNISHNKDILDQSNKKIKSTSQNQDNKKISFTSVKRSFNGNIINNNIIIF